MDLLMLFLLALSFPYGNSEGSAPIIREHPKSFTARRNHPATLNCDAVGATKYDWYKDGEKINFEKDGNSRRTLLFGGSLFFLRVISNKRETDSGTYFCQASNRYGFSRSRNASLIVASIGDSFLEEPDPVVKARRGHFLKLPCRAPKGVPAPLVIWKREGRTVTNDSRTYVTPSGDLIFEEVMDRDAGTYVCVAENSAGTREARASSLSVLSLPSFEERPKNLSAVAGSTVEFKCTASGIPAPVVTWRRLDGNMPLDRTIYAEGRSLIISGVSVSDTGVYVCEAKNDAGAAVMMGSLKVVSSPSLKEKPSDSLTLVGKEVKLTCRVDGDPKPLIIWKLPFHGRNSLLMGGQRSEKASVSSDGNTLKLKKVQIGDKGVYQCWGISIGGGVSTSANVVVVDALPPPVIGVRPEDQEVVQGSSVTFPCEVVSEAAEPVVTWWYQRAAHLPPHQVIPQNSFEILATGSLSVKDVSEKDAGIYTCRVMSLSGSTEAEAILKVSKEASSSTTAKSFTTLAPPSKPRILSYNDTSVQIAWLPNSRITSSNAESYTVEYWRAPWQEWRVAKAEIKDTSCVLPELQPHTAHIFLVRAVDKNGESFPSPWSNMVYTESPPNSAIFLEEERQAKRKLSKPTITLTAATLADLDSVVLSWKSLEGSEGEVDGVIVYSVGEMTIASATVLGAASSSHTVKDLRPDTHYIFFLVPFWRTYEGVPSNAQVITTPQQAPLFAPSGLTAEAFASGSTLVRWQPLTKDEARGVIIGYRVSLSHNNLTTVEETQNPWFEIQGLLGSKFYTVRVAAKSGGGVGPWGSPILINLSQVPSAGGRQDVSATIPEVPSVLYAPPHPVWLLYLLVPLLIIVVIVTLLWYLRRMRKKSTNSTLEVVAGGPPPFYHSSGMYDPAFRSVNMYGEPKTWRPIESDRDSSLSSAKLLRREHLVNEYAEPRIQSTEPYATTALLAPSSPRPYHQPVAWRHNQNQEESIQVNWLNFIPPPPPCPPPLHSTEADTCSSSSTSDSADRRHYNPSRGSSQYENAGGGSEQYERPCDIATPSHRDQRSNRLYPPYGPLSCRETGFHSDPFQTFSTLQDPLRKLRVDPHPNRTELPKSNTH